MLVHRNATTVVRYGDGLAIFVQRNVDLCAMIAAAPGIEEVQKQCPNTQIYVCTIDPILNENKFIVPGLGDAGDRIFNTHH